MPAASRYGDGEAIGRRLFIKIVCRHEAGGPFHVLYYQGWIAWNEPCEVTGDHAASRVYTPAGSISQDQRERLAAIEVVSRSGASCERAGKR
jgi:hypothetical protein